MGCYGVTMSTFLPLQVFSLAWSPCSRLCATVCKDGKLRVYEPRKSTQPIKVIPPPT